MQLSVEQILAFPAKTTQEDSKRVLGISVYQHSLLAGCVLAALLNLFPKRDDRLPLSLPSLAASHDIGKVNPGFLRKLLKSVSEDGLTDKEQRYWNGLIDDFSDVDEVSHPIVSYACLKSIGVDKRIAMLVAMHHGYPAPHTVSSDSAWLYGGPDWAEARESLLKLILDRLNQNDFPKRDLDRERQKVLSDIWLGFVVVADWIASQVDKAFHDDKAEEIAKNLICKAGFKPRNIIGSLSFEEVFGVEPRPAQEALSEIYAGPGIYCFEAPTGYGKTEAALGLAYRALTAGDASGVYFALPTQLTSTRLYDRFRKFVARISPLGDESVQLIHGGVRQKQGTYESDMLEGQFGKEAAPGGTWFTVPRRAILAPFGVGTIDQALLSELPTIRFSCVRAAGLFGKVIIIDEVHSYDAYTSSLLKMLLQRLIKIGSVVVLLSATLTKEAKQNLLGCSVSELENDLSPICFTRKLADTEAVMTRSLPIREQDSRDVRVKLLEWDDTKEAIAEAIRRAKRGEQVLWIENDILSAQLYYEIFLSEGIDCAVLHSRFRPIEREILEEKWTKLFGKFSGAELLIFPRAYRREPLVLGNIFKNSNLVLIFQGFFDILYVCSHIMIEPWKTPSLILVE